jgi:RimJ/RimL family protein N-acetyltransferase
MLDTEPLSGPANGRETTTDAGVRLRLVRSSDLPIFYWHQCDPVAVRMAAVPSRNERDFFLHWKEILADEQVLVRAIVHERRVAGNIVSFAQSGRTVIGYWLGREYWGRGIATRALAEFLCLVEPRPVYAFVAKHNGRSVRVLQKCGFVVLGEGPGAPDADGRRVTELALRLDAPPALDGGG